MKTARARGPSEILGHSGHSAAAAGPCRASWLRRRLLLPLRPGVSIAACEDFATACANIPSAHENVSFQKLKSHWCAMLPASDSGLKMRLLSGAGRTGGVTPPESPWRQPFEHVKFDRQRVAADLACDDFREQRCPREATRRKTNAGKDPL